MQDKYLSLQGQIYLDNVPIGNVPKFKITSEKFVFILEDFSRNTLNEVFSDDGTSKNLIMRLDLPTSIRKLRFEGVNTAYDNHPVIINADVQFTTFSNFNVISNDLSSLTLSGLVLSTITLEYKETSKLQSIKIEPASQIYYEKKDLKKVNNQLFHILSKNIILNRDNILNIETAKESTTMLCLKKVNIPEYYLVQEPLENVIKFFEGFDKSDTRDLRKISQALVEIQNQLEDQTLEKYL